jgi:hypothetical protein
LTTLSVAPGCIGVELPNGKKIDADKSGKVVIDDPKVEKFALNSSAGKMGAVTRTSFNFNTRNDNGKVCQTCSFTGFKWQTICPKCNNEMTIKTEE